MCDQFNLNESTIVDTEALTREAGLPLTKFTHEETGIRFGVTYDRLETDKSKYKNSKIIFLVRDPKDTIVSFYFQATKRRGQTHINNISELIRDDFLGIKKILKFHKIWYDNQKIPKDFLLIKYEDLKKDTLGNLKKVMEFLEVKNLRDDLIENAVEFSSFERMKKMESSKQFKEKALMNPGNPEDKDSYKVRKGKVGGYVDYLSAEDIAYIDKAMEEIGCPFYGKHVEKQQQ